MRYLQSAFSLSLRLGLVLLVCTTNALSQAALSTLQGRVQDERGDVIAGAVIILVDANGQSLSETTNQRGDYAFKGLPAGQYNIAARALGFAPYEARAVNLAKGGQLRMDLTLTVTIAEELEVHSEAGANVSAEENKNQIEISGALLEALPDEAESMASLLASIVGVSSGPQGVQTYVDGTRSQRIPPKDLIREIRINRNPFSVEYDRPGSNRIEVFTKPGTEHIHGEAFSSLSLKGWSSRNPFSSHPVAFSAKTYGGSLSGAIIPNRLSGFLNFERRNIDDGVVIHATILDPLLNISSFNQLVSTPGLATSFSPRIDYTLNSTTTLSTRYSYYSAANPRSGLTAFSLPSTSYSTSYGEHTLSVSLLKAFSPKSFNDAKLQFTTSSRNKVGDNSLPTINVLESFIGGGAAAGQTQNEQRLLEFTDAFNWTRGRHRFNVGGRLRRAQISDFSTDEFGGAYLFTGGLAPVLDSSNQPVQNGSEQNNLTFISSIERYRRTEMLRKQGYSPALIQSLAGGPTQFSIITGNPHANISQLDWAGFFSDEWQIRRNMSLTMGLRYESQTIIESRPDFAPRLAFVWSPDADKKGPSHTVIRLGMGLFYDRISETISLHIPGPNLDARRNYLVTDETAAGRLILSSYPNLPPPAWLAAFANTRTNWRLDANLRSPSTLLSGINVERSFPHGIMLTATYSNRHRVHELRTRNINAPDADGLRPIPDIGNIFNVESNAVFNQQQVILQTRYVSKKLMLFANYIWSKSESDSDGPFSFPANANNLKADYGRSALDIHHSLAVMMSINGPWGLQISPYFTFRTGAPFNITTGYDTNFDGLLTDRPAVALDASGPSVKRTPLGLFDLQPTAGESIIPRNAGQGPGFAQLDLRVSKTLKLAALGAPIKALANLRRQGDKQAVVSKPLAGNQTDAPAAAPNKSEQKLVLSIQAFNLTNHTNLGPVIGNLVSPLFGRSNSLYGGYGFGASSNPSYNRRIELQVRYSF